MNQQGDVKQPARKDADEGSSCQNPRSSSYDSYNQFKRRKKDHGQEEGGNDQGSE